MKDNINVQLLQDNFESCRNKFLLCKFNEAVFNGNFVQVKLDVLSEESEYVLKVDEIEDVFEYNSKNNVCYVKFSYFYDFILANDEDYLDSNRYEYDLNYFEDQISLIEDYLYNKLVLIKPYYYYNQQRHIFFKNGNIHNIINVNETINDFYFSIPILNDNQYEKYKLAQPFALNDMSKNIMGTPEYLYYNNKVIVSNLKPVDGNEIYWIRDKTIERSLYIDVSNLSDDERFIPQLSNYAYISRKALLINQANLNKANNLEIEEKKEDNESKGDDSFEGKVIKDFYDYTRSVNLSYSLVDIENFYTCVKSRLLTIIAGMSGTGKSRLPLKFAEYFNMSIDNNRLLFMPVSPSYTEPSDILGFLNPNTHEYIPSETGLIEILKHAMDNPNMMHMIIFDEMNLSQIEHWFAPFISLLEMEPKNRYLKLYSPQQECNNSTLYPSKIKISDNVIFVGTINLDETTKNISDRLIDRSMVINLKKMPFVNYQAEQSNILTQDNKLKVDDFYNLVNHDEDKFNYIDYFEMRELLFFDTIHNELNKIDYGKGISFRCLRNIALYLKNAPEEFTHNQAFDYAFKQTIMKKIRGDGETYRDFLGSVDDESNFSGILPKILKEYEDLSLFTETFNEIRNKIMDLKKYGFSR